MKQVQVLQHVPFEGLGSIAAWLAAQRADVGFTRLFAGDPMPRADRIGALIALGGPMSVNDEDALEWLRPEKELGGKAVRFLVDCCAGRRLAGTGGSRRQSPDHARQ